MKEIGSEFWIEEGIDRKNVTSKAIHVLSGRTALDFIIRDIKKSNKYIDMVYFPDYCCDSMIEPFLKHNITLKYYHVYSDGKRFHLEYSNQHHCKIVYLMHYFGYKIPELYEIAKEEIEKGTIVIYDATHMINGFDKIPFSYLFCSYRKWFYSNSAAVLKRGNFVVDVPKEINSQYVLLRERAASLKAKYILGESIEKKEYLRLFQEAEDILEKDSYDYMGNGEEPLFLNDLIEKRRENAKLIMKKLKELGNIRLAVNSVEKEDCPLFVPILLDESKRNNIKNELVKKSIYCPVHWPISKLHFGIDNIFYSKELSLICDQRYGKKDIIREIRALHEITK